MENFQTAVIMGFVWLVALAVFVTALFAVAWVHYGRAGEVGYVPRENMGFREYFPEFLSKYKLRLILAAFLALFVHIILGLLALLLVFAKKQDKVKYLSRKQMLEKEEAGTAAWLAHLGSDHQARAQRIEQMFADKSGALQATAFMEWMTWSGPDKRQSHVFGEIGRDIAAMDNREREHLQIVELLNSAAGGRNRDYRLWRFSLIWGGGKGLLHHFQYNGLADSEVQDCINVALRQSGATVDQVVSRLNSHLVEQRGTGSDVPHEFSEVVQTAAERLSQGGQTWLKPAGVKDTVFAAQGAWPLHIGSFADGTALTYSGESSILTIAPPGSGKTQCNVFPNLLAWRGPAVVLDVSGDIYESTSQWRAENVGPVFKFSPLEPESSHCYNPLAFVRSSPDFIWEDAKLLAEMMIVPSNASDPFWENEARTVLTAAIAHVCYANPPEARPLHSLLDIIYGGQAWEEMLLGLKMAVDVRSMVQHGQALAGMNEKTLSSVLQTARSSLGAWAGERIARATRRSDWSPLDLRSGTPTIYICIRPNEVEAYLSLLRVFIGQHIRMLTAGAIPPRDAPPILFMLDELPRLRNMPPVDEALNIGRKYGLRLWLFAQSVGQLQEAYKNADGMMGSCAVRIYMNPGGADGLAEKLSEEIGYADSFTDGQRKRRVEAAELAGPGYRDDLIVFGTNSRPARVRKDFAWKHDELKARMGVMHWNAENVDA